MPEEEKIKKEEETVDIDTSGPDVDINLPEEKDPKEVKVTYGDEKVETSDEKQETKTEEKPVEEYVHRGLASRDFTRVWTISDDVRVEEVSYVDGVLSVILQRIIPEHQKRQDWL